VHWALASVDAHLAHWIWRIEVRGFPPFARKNEGLGTLLVGWSEGGHPPTQLSLMKV
jgi:hypothetical protein